MIDKRMIVSDGNFYHQWYWGDVMICGLDVIGSKSGYTDADSPAGAAILQPIWDSKTE